MSGTPEPTHARSKFGSLRLPGQSLLLTPFIQNTTASPKSADHVPAQLLPSTSGRATQFAVLPGSHYHDHAHASQLSPSTSPDPEIDPNTHTYPLVKNSTHGPRFQVPRPHTPNTPYRPPSPQLPSSISPSTQAARKSQPLTGNSEYERSSPFPFGIQNADSGSFDHPSSFFCHCWQTLTTFELPILQQVLI